MTTTAQRSPTFEDFLELPVLSDVQLAPDGSVAVFVQGKLYDQKNKRSPSTIMAVSLDGGEPRPFSTGDAVDEMPRWSPDGRMLAFLSDRPHGLPEDAHAARSQVYLLPRDGGEAHRLTAAVGEIHDLAWAPDGLHLIILMDEPEPEDVRRQSEERGEAVDVEQRPLYARLWSVSLAGGETSPLTPQGLQVWDFAVAADGGRAVLIASELPYEWSWYQARLVVAALDGTFDVFTIYAGARQLAYPRFSPDGHSVAVTSCIWSDRGYYGGDVLLIPITGGETRNLTAGRPVSALWAEWEPDGRSLLCCGYEAGEIALWRLSLGGDLGTLWRAPAAPARTQTRLSRAGDTIALLRSDPDNPTDLWVARLGADTVADWRRLTTTHRQTEGCALGEMKALHWHAHDGTPIQALLALPPGYREGSRLPLVVLVHGGPAGLFAFEFSPGSWSRPLAAAGMAVLMPNPRGSIGWGAAFTEANLGDMGGADYLDILAGIDHVVNLGIADPERLGIAGWSYGGFMSAWAITQSDRFKVAIVGAGIADWRSFHGTTNIPTWDAIFYGLPGHPADPYDLEGPYTRFSPLTHVDNARTPTLILHGEQDECVPVGQGYQLFRALRDQGTPAEMTVYPRAGHALKERAHLRDRYARMADWFNRYLSGSRE